MAGPLQMMSASDGPEQQPVVPKSQEDVAADFDRFQHNYTQQVSQAVAFSGLERGFFVKVKSDCLLRLAAQFCGDLQEIRALDLGCGVGEYHEGLQSTFKSLSAIDVSKESTFKSLSAIDVSKESVKYAKARYPSVEYQVYGGGRLPYDSESFDLAFAICVLHHVPPSLWAGLMEEMYRVVAPGGLAVLLEHNPYNPATQYIVKTCPIDADAVLLSKSTAARLMRDARFAVVETRTILSVPPVNGLMATLDGVLGHLPFGAQYYVAGQK